MMYELFLLKLLFWSLKPNKGKSDGSNFLEGQFKTVQSHLSKQLLNDNISRVYKDELRAFVRVRSQRSICRGKVCYSNVPNTKSELVERCIDLKDEDYSGRLYPDCPIFPSLLEPSGNN